MADMEAEADAEEEAIRGDMARRPDGWRKDAVEAEEQDAAEAADEASATPRRHPTSSTTTGTIATAVGTMSKTGTTARHVPTICDTRATSRRQRRRTRWAAAWRANTRPSSQAIQAIHAISDGPQDNSGASKDKDGEQGKDADKQRTCINRCHQWQPQR